MYGDWVQYVTTEQLSPSLMLPISGSQLFRTALYRRITSPLTNNLAGKNAVNWCDASKICLHYRKCAHKYHLRRRALSYTICPTVGINRRWMEPSLSSVLSKTQSRSTLLYCLQHQVDERQRRYYLPERLAFVIGDAAILLLGGVKCTEYNLTRL